MAQLDGVAIAKSARVVSESITPVSVAANTSAEQSFSVSWALKGDCGIVVPPTIGTAVAPEYARCDADGTIEVCWTNTTAGGLIPDAGVYTFLLYRA